MTVASESTGLAPGQLPQLFLHSRQPVVLVAQRGALVEQLGIKLKRLLTHNAARQVERCQRELQLRVLRARSKFWL